MAMSMTSGGWLGSARNRPAAPPTGAAANHSASTAAVRQPGRARPMAWSVGMAGSPRSGFWSGAGGGRWLLALDHPRLHGLDPAIESDPAGGNRTDRSEGECGGRDGREQAGRPGGESGHDEPTAERRDHHPHRSAEERPQNSAGALAGDRQPHAEPDPTIDRPP